MNGILDRLKSDEVTGLRNEIAALQDAVRDRDEIIARQERELDRFSPAIPALREIENLLGVSQAELGAAIGKIEDSTNRAIQDFSNISGLFGEIIRSTGTLVNDIKAKLCSVRDKNADSIGTAGIRDKYEAIVNYMLAEMTSIVTRKDDDLALLNEVNSKVLSIESFSEEIGKIALNSHILSINAKIEAAHVGDAGKSFYVVATEVSRMAQETRLFSDRIDEDLKTAKNFIENATGRLKKAIDVEALFISSTILLLKDVFMSIIDSLVPLINVVEKYVGESSGINSNIQNAVVNLQFEDITKQISSHVMHLMAGMIGKIQSIDSGSKEPDPSSGIIKNETVLQDMHRLFTMEAERRIAGSILAPGNEAEDAPPDAIATEDEVTFF
jgi:methyl-accepting chemotaxis protein